MWAGASSPDALAPPGSGHGLATSRIMISPHGRETSAKLCKRFDSALKIASSIFVFVLRSRLQTLAFVLQHSLFVDLRGNISGNEGNELTHMAIKSYCSKSIRAARSITLQYKAESLLQPPCSGNVDALGVCRKLQPSKLLL